MLRRASQSFFICFCLAVGLPLFATSSLAVLDIQDRGKVLNAGAFAMRVTNAGIIGNAFFDRGLSSDPSFEYPRGSGHEALQHAELWVGAKLETGERRVSGGPMLEWRPTLAAGDTVLQAYAGDPRGRWHYDDDGDGRIDEDPLNGLDDDGDGLVDEDFGISSQQVLTARYRDDEAAALLYAYPGEQHVPLGLTVDQEARAWGRAGFDNLAGCTFTITNHGQHQLRDVMLGIYADLDSRNRNNPAGHLNDRVQNIQYALTIPKGVSTLNSIYSKNCFTSIKGSVPFVYDGLARSGLPASAVLGLSHTTDPLGYITNTAFQGVTQARLAIRAPLKDTTFRYSVFAQDLPPGQGGPPRIDDERYAAMTGAYPTSSLDNAHDYAILLSCGPFTSLKPGESVEFSIAFIAVDSLAASVASAIAAHLAYMGRGYNFLKDSSGDHYDQGDTGINGHEICYEPPPGVVFSYDPHCPEKLYSEPSYPRDPPPPAVPNEVIYRHGVCVWSDLDCDACTGMGGEDLTRHWELGPPLPPAPRVHAWTSRDTAFVEWGHDAESAIRDSSYEMSGYTFAGYRVYRLDDWTRESLLPELRQWQQLGEWSPDTTRGAHALASIANGLLYRINDAGLRLGFDYSYAVTTVAHARFSDNPLQPAVEIESPLIPIFRDRVVPHDATLEGGNGVWVVPNPYRGSAPWERPPVYGDAFTRHIDFLGLPRAICVIRIYTVSGDFVARLDHNGTGGDGQASWNLISRNGQDVESGIYLFTVDSSQVHQVGRFVIIR